MPTHRTFLRGPRGPRCIWSGTAASACLCLLLCGDRRAGPAARGMPLHHQQPDPVPKDFDGPDTFGVRLMIRDTRWAWGPRAGPASLQVARRADRAKHVQGQSSASGSRRSIRPARTYQLRRETEQQSASPVEFALAPAHHRASRCGSHDEFHAARRRADDRYHAGHAAGDARHGARRHDQLGRQSRARPRDRHARIGCFALFGLFFREDNGAGFGRRSAADGRCRSGWKVHAALQPRATDAAAGCPRRGSSSRSATRASSGKKNASGSKRNSGRSCAGRRRP